MERAFIFDQINTWYDWNLYLIAKDIPDPEPDFNFVEIEGMSGTLDLSEVLAGEITYRDRTITATFWTDQGTYSERERLLRQIARTLHGKKKKIIEPDDVNSYLYGRIKITSIENNRAYAEFSIEAVCEPWRYARFETERRIEVNGETAIEVVINNSGVKTLCPLITVDGLVNITVDGNTTALESGSCKIAQLKLRQGTNVVGVSGVGTVVFTYREGDL